MLVDDDCLGSTQVDAFMPSLAIHLCSGDNVSITEVCNALLSSMLFCSLMLVDRSALEMWSGTHFSLRDVDRCTEPSRNTRHSME